MRTPVLLLTLVSLLIPSLAVAQADIETRGQVVSDLRLTVPGTDQVAGTPDYLVDRMENLARLTAGFWLGDVQAVVDLAVVFRGDSQVNTMEDQLERSQVDPYYLESDALYIEIMDFLVEGVDLRVGRQIVEWGTADRFNPTSVINGLDLEDPIEFGKRVANEMAVLSITPDWRIEGEETPILDEINLSLVAVPVFRSGMLPRSSMDIFSEPDQFRAFLNSELLLNLVELQKLYMSKGGQIAYSTIIEEPEVELENFQVGGRLSFSLVGLDLGAMFYHGFDHNTQPHAVRVKAITEDPDTGARGVFDIPDLSNPDTLEAARTLIELLPDDFLSELTGYTDLEVSYPEITVVGADMATSLDFLGGIGLWAEWAMTFHDPVNYDIHINDQVFEETQVDGDKFWKLAAGMDYTITRWWYVNVQYLHGFVDEFGADALNDYVVAGSDFKILDEKILVRIFGIYQFQDQSMILYPSLNFDFWQGVDLMAGALLHVGDDDSKFGNRTAGANLLLTQARYTF